MSKQQYFFGNGGPKSDWIPVVPQFTNPETLEYLRNHQTFFIVRRNVFSGIRNAFFPAKLFESQSGFCVLSTKRKEDISSCFKP